MAIRLKIVDPRDGGLEHQRGFAQDRVVLGRARSCDVCLPDMAVSTRHAEIRLEANNYKIVDLGSLNGTHVGGKRLVPHRPKLLGNGDRIAIAGFTVEFGLGVTSGIPDPRREAVWQAREMISSMLSGGDGAVFAPALMVLRGPSKAARYEMVEQPCAVKIGRGRSVEIRLEDPDVSREHAVVEWSDNVVTVRDLGSHNGVVFQGKRVEEAVLSPGDTFVVGNTTLALEHPADSALVAIQEAPEEETSTFSPSLREISQERLEEAVTEPPKQTEPHPQPEEPPDPADLPPVGPDDPLSYPGQPGYVRTTREIPRPVAQEKSDMGLIIVGAIIVVAAVAALVYLFS